MWHLHCVRMRIVMLWDSVNESIIIASPVASQCQHRKQGNHL
jgi:hypothetical protein